MADKQKTEKAPETLTERTANRLGAAGGAVKDGMIRSLRGVNEIEAEMVSVVRSTVSDTLRATGSIADETVHVARDAILGALQATDQVGNGLVVTMKSVAKGVILGVSDVGGDAIQAASAITKAAVQGASELGSDIGLTARHAVDGVRRHLGRGRPRLSLDKAVALRQEEPVLDSGGRRRPARRAP